MSSPAGSTMGVGLDFARRPPRRNGVPHSPRGLCGAKWAAPEGHAAHTTGGTVGGARVISPAERLSRSFTPEVHG